MSKRQLLTIAQKNELRRFHASQKASKITQKELLEWVQMKFGKTIGRSSIGKILNKAPEDEALVGGKRMRMRLSKYLDVEAALLTYILENRDTIAFTDDHLWEKARSVRHVSMSWVQRFKGRHGISGKNKVRHSVGGCDEGDVKEHADNRALMMQALERKRDEILLLAQRAQQQQGDEGGSDDGDETEDNEKRDAGASSQEEKGGPHVAAKLASRASTRASSARQAPSAKPTFSIVSKTTGRVELENQSSTEKSPLRQRPEKETSPTKKRARRVSASSAVAAPSPGSAAKLRIQEENRDRAEEEERVETQQHQQQQNQHHHHQQQHQQQPPVETNRKTELEEREVELRVEGLRCDNVLKRIKIAEENMLARKRLKDAGISQEEIDALLPVVRTVHRSS